jgi:hypothetical protein
LIFSAPLIFKKGERRSDGSEHSRYISVRAITIVEKAADEAMRAIGNHPVGRRYRSIFGPNIDWRTDGLEGLLASLSTSTSTPH